MMAKESFRKMTPWAKSKAESTSIYKDLARIAKAVVEKRIDKKVRQQTKWIVFDFEILGYYRYHLGEYTLVVWPPNTRWPHPMDTINV